MTEELKSYRSVYPGIIYIQFQNQMERINIGFKQAVKDLLMTRGFFF